MNLVFFFKFEVESFFMVIFSLNSFFLQALNQTVLVGGQNQSIQWISNPSRLEIFDNANWHGKGNENIYFYIL